MKLELTNKIQAVIDAYHNNSDTHNQAMKNIVNPYRIKENVERFTKDGLKQMINGELYDVLSAWKNTDTILNQKINETIASAKDTFMKKVSIDKTKDGSADYSIKINNAIQFLKMELESKKHGTNTGNDSASKFDIELYHILKDFVDDYDTMRMFKKMVEIKVDTFVNVDGTCRFPQTFGKFMRFEGIMNSFEELENLGSKVFLYERTADGSLITANHLTFPMYTDGYKERLAERLMIDTATVIDGLVEELD